ncbi:hypothetical protein MRX96_019999 [Rhipicephalus microplus]
MTLPLVVIKGAGCNLLGRNWFPHLGIQITGINDVSGDELVSKLLDKYQSVFDEDISGHIGPAVQLDLVEGAKPNGRYLCATAIYVIASSGEPDGFRKEPLRDCPSKQPSVMTTICGVFFTLAMLACLLPWCSPSAQGNRAERVFAQLKALRDCEQRAFYDSRTNKNGTCE